MKREYSAWLTDDNKRKELDKIIGKINTTKEFQKNFPDFSYYHYLKATKNNSHAETIRHIWKQFGNRQFPDDWLNKLRIDDINPEIGDFPPDSWFLTITFNLDKPYLSKDDRELYIIDNPVKKEWVFRVPYIAASQ